MTIVAGFIIKDSLLKSPNGVKQVTRTTRQGRRRRLQIFLASLMVSAISCPITSPAARADERQNANASVASYDYLQQVNQSIGDHQVLPSGTQFDAGWWQPLVPQPLRTESAQIALSLEQSLVLALEHSKQVKVFSELPMIRETAIIEADSAFDWTRYMEGRWDDTTNPVGNALTTGAGRRYYEDEHLTGQIGARRRLRSGGQFDINQQLGHQRTNSTFFTPNPQGSARLNVSFTQPLWRGRGKVYNNSLIVLAQIDKKVADDEFNRQLQSHLLEVARSYWSLYLERAVLYQKINSYIRGKQVFDRLDSRRDIDARPSQIVSAEASLKTRVSELVRARAAVKNAESRLRSLINDNQLLDSELIPIDQPTFEVLPVNLEESVTVAFQLRPELHQALKNIKAASVRLNMAKHEMLPVLNLVTDAYLSGLAGDGDVGEAFSNEFSDGRPSYGIGLQYEFPVCNRAASARKRRRELEIRQLRNQYSSTLETVRLEVEVAVREFQTSQTELSTKHQAMNARVAQLDALTKRWENLPGEEVTASLALENLLLAQDRLATSEFEYLQSQLTFKLAIFNLKRAMGTLLKSEQVVIGQTSSCGVPQQIVEKPNLDDLPTQYNTGSVSESMPPPMPEDFTPMPQDSAPMIHDMAPPANNFDSVTPSTQLPPAPPSPDSASDSDHHPSSDSTIGRSPVVVAPVGMLTD